MTRKKIIVYFIVFLVPILLALGVQIDRISLESSLWCDEIYSVQIAGQDLDRLVMMTSKDAHPPGYYLFLKSWIMLVGKMGIEPGVIAGRLPGVLLLFLTAFFTFVIFHRLNLPSIQLLMILCVILGSQAALNAKNMRSYALAGPALTACFLALSGVYLHLRIPDARINRVFIITLWIVYLSCSLLALWCHLLSGIVLFWVGLAWIYLALRLYGKLGCGSAGNRLFMMWGFVIHLLIVAGITPWLMGLSGNIAYLGSASLEWMTPPTVGNLLRVFYDWLPLGRYGYEIGLASGQGWIIIAGVLSALTPLTFISLALTGRKARHFGSISVGGLHHVGWCGASIVIFYILTLWVLHRQGVIQVFHGPRYPGMVSAIWVISIIILVVHYAGRRGLREGVVWLVMLAWMVSGICGQLLEFRDERKLRMNRNLDILTNALLNGDEQVYAYPSRLMPWFGESLSGLNIKPVESISNAPPGLEETWLLQLNPWEDLQDMSDRAVLGAVYGGRICDNYQRYRRFLLGDKKNSYMLIRLRGFHPDEARELSGIK